MTLVFTHNAPGASQNEQHYADEMGTRYEYPRKLYGSTVAEGDTFVYYQGQKSPGVPAISVLELLVRLGKAITLTG